MQSLAPGPVAAGLLTRRAQVRVSSGEPDKQERTFKVAPVNREPRGESLGFFAFLVQISGVLG